MHHFNFHNFKTKHFTLGILIGFSALQAQGSNILSFLSFDEDTTARKTTVDNKRETIKKKLESESHFLIPRDLTKSPVTAPIVPAKTEVEKVGKISADKDANAPVVKYRRSSLYSLMMRDTTRMHEIVIQNSFGDSEIPEKFNDNNVGPYVIELDPYSKDQTAQIKKFIDENQITKKLVAKWFNRSAKGGFNMDLIAERGLYNASDLDVNLAKMNTRGTAVLADAGEELIGNTFVLVNDYKFVSKEEIAAKTKMGLSLMSSALAMVPGTTDLQKTADVASTAATVAGKGYVIKTTSYLFRLVWNDSVAAVFYNNYWTDDKNLDLAKKEAFEKSDLFTLKMVGSEVAWADVQSSIFTQKSEEELISIATVKATDAVIAKLQKKYEQFRTSTPLLNADPLTAKIGLKEALEPGDKYEVLEQTMDATGKTAYKKVGVLKVTNKIWDNRYMADQEPDKKDKDQFTTFSKVSGATFYPGMLIKQK